MNKMLGIIIFLLILYGVLLASDPGARTYANHVNVGGRIGLLGILTLAAALVIVTGSIDLSLGSTVALCATVCSLMLVRDTWKLGFTEVSMPDPYVRLAIAIPAVLCLGMLIGLVNGLLVTYLRVQAFIVTLCGMFIYRGVARWLTGERTSGLPDELADVHALFEKTWFGMPAHLVIFLASLAVAAVFLHVSVYGRCFYALGSNERAARFSGISVNFYRVLAFVLCSVLTSAYAMLWLFKNTSVQPSASGNSLELYAIAGTVLGGFSLRGGDGMVCGILVGACIIEILPNITNMLGVANSLQPIVIGLALLVGATVDELLRQRRATRKA